MRARAAALAAAALAACAPAPLLDDGLDYPERRMRLASLKGWQMRGRVAIDTGEDAGQGRFQWRRSGDALMLVIRGPFGAGGVRIEGTPEAMRVTSRGETWRLDDPEPQLSELLGWWLPVTSLEHWLLGLPDDAYPARTAFGRYGTVRALEQRLWRLDYGEYAQRAGVLIPGRIDFSHGPLEISMTIDAFEPLPAAASSLNRGARGRHNTAFRADGV